tara:strand:- start:71 stop:742 length:672 start_codon:yes stop_codon:yes gene_type:complete
MDEINYVHFVNEKPLSIFAPSWNYFIAEKLLLNIDYNRLKDYLLSKKQEVLAIEDNLDDGGTGLGNDTTTARYRSYNIFSWDQPDINILKQEILSMVGKYYMRVSGKELSQNFLLFGWMNIMKKGDRVENHNHGFRSDSYLSGNFIVSCNNTKTVYNNPFQQYVKENKLLRMVEEDEDDPTYYASKNTEGKLTLFPNYIPHFTTEHRSYSYRITLAFELKLIK